MINIPEEVKELYHRDGVFKNIRIHFQEGERSDICNDQIVNNTVKLQESLCSQEHLKFGLCESPTFECEVVGVSNVKGAMIEVYSEIECPQTVEGAEFKTDIQKWVYPVPMGVFKIDSCKRQADMLHRKIIAYSLNLEAEHEVNGATAIYINRVFQHSSTAWLRTADWDLYKLFATTSKAKMGGIFNYRPITLEKEMFYYSITEGGYIYDVEVYGYCLDYPLSGYFGQEPALTYIQGMPQLITNDEEIKDFYNFVIPERFKNNNYQITKDLTSFENAVNNVIVHTIKSANDEYWTDVCEFANYFLGSLGLTGSTEQTISFGPQFFIPTHIDYVVYPPEGEREIQTLNIRINDEATWPAYICETLTDEPPTIKIPRIINESGNNVPDLSGVFDSFLGYLELNGIFARYNRYYSVDLVTIQQIFGLPPGSTLFPGMTIYPESASGGRLYPNEYSSLWYDDDYGMPYGAIKCEFQTTGSDSAEYILYMNGYSEMSPKNSYLTYDISDNYMVKNSKWTFAQIRSLCEKFARNIIGLTYINVSAECIGQPYIEVGDTFEILTKTNDSITMIVLGRTLTGEQLLTDKFTSN